jgi:glycosyltransferase involved in cell wall biosynthesis
MNEIKTVAQACGAPTVGFSVGGIKEVVRPGKTGTLVPLGDVTGMRDAIASLLQDDQKRDEMAAESRLTSIAEYASQVQAKSYVTLYEKMLSKTPSLDRGHRG